jgi:hypothetical protein
MPHGETKVIDTKMDIHLILLTVRNQARNKKNQTFNFRVRGNGDSKKTFRSY